MALRVDAATAGSTTIITVSGRLAGREIREFLRVCRATEGEIELDLTGLRSANSQGIEAIRKLVREGRKLRGASPFIRLLLNDR